MSMAKDEIREDELRLVEGVELLKVTEGKIEPDAVPGELTVEHADYLTAHAVDLEVATALGVRSVLTKEDVAGLDDPWPVYANFPSILFPWVSPDGRTEIQMRPDNATEDMTGRARKYMFRRGMDPVLWAVRSVETAERIVIVEGTKQCLAAASYAPDGVSIYGIAGCRLWQRDGVPIPDLAVADGKEVVILLDADAAGNLDVYRAGTELAEALDMEGALKVTFARLPGGGKAGLDDVLARQPAERRAGYLSRLIDSSKSKPADTKPTRKVKDQDKPGGEGRVTVVINKDRLDVINDITKALLDRWDGTALFNHGGVISQLDGTRMVPVDRGSARDILQHTMVTVAEKDGAQGTSYGYAWPDSDSMAAVMSRATRFSPLDRLAHAPFVRPDGSIVTEPGYDAATNTILIPDKELAGLEVPEDPGPAEIQRARLLLMEEWLGDFPFAGDTDRANCLALLVTPAIRGLIPQVPMAVVDGLQMGVGKNLLADSILTVYTGQPARPMNFVDEAEELRKQITAAFRTGQEFFVFDEAHTLDGAPLAQALTAHTWQDRILGVSHMAEFPNRVTWISLGNQVHVKGDITRRVYRIALQPTYDNPQDRPSSAFRHPGQSGLDLGAWTRANRRDLMTAILTLVRAWFAAGQPYTRRGSSFGSFETWERYAGGIVQVAGLTGFLDNIKAWRSESDFDSQYWLGHMTWLLETFGDKAFRTADVRATALTDPQSYLAPPRLDDPGEKTYGKALGEAYSRLKGRRYEGHRIERAGHAHGHVTVWRVYGPEGESIEVPEPPAPDDPNEHGEARGPDAADIDGPEEIEDAAEPAEVPATASADVLTLDLEAGDAGDLYRTGPGYVRLSGIARDDDEIEIDGAYPARHAAGAMANAAVITGHNIMAFDIPALVREGTLQMPRVHGMARQGRFADALLMARYLDPPMARDKGVDATRKYDLDSLSERLGLGRKDDAAKALAKKYGGWAQIPTDPDTEDGAAFRAYLHQDVNLSRMVHARLMDELGGTMPDYLVREHRIAAIASQISLNGFRVDVPELERRVAGVHAQKADAVRWLADNIGLPLDNGKGTVYKSPIGTKLGKRRLEDALLEAGATSIWRTEKAGDIDISGDHMRHLAAEYGHIPRVREIAQNVYKIVSARSVYETISNHLVGDRVHAKISFHQSTGRWSSTEPGLTVLGKHHGRHRERMVFLPEPGEVILTADLSQVDMRGVAGLSQDRAYIEMLKTDDPHSAIAEMLFGDKGRRQDAKAIGHGWNYGRSLQAISQMEDIEPQLVVRFDRSMRERFGRLVEWREEVRAVAGSGVLLDNGWGRKMRPDPQRAYTQGPALMGQGSARDIMMEGLLALPAEILPMLRAQVHDEIVLSVPAADAPDVARAVVDALSFEWRGVPITADTSPVGVTWGHCYEKG